MRETFGPPVGGVRRPTPSSTAIPHAVTSVTKGAQTDTYEYDANGNMTCRVEAGVSFIQNYNAENRTSSIIKLETGTCASPANYAGKWDFAYDGDGVRTATLYTPYTSGSPGTPVLTTYYFGGLYEVTGSTVRKYYAISGQTVAMKEGSTLSYFLTDHLGSTMAVVNSSGAVTQQQRYLPFGQVRTISGSSAVTATDFGYTFQRSLGAELGLMDYRARFYSSALGRFIQPDTASQGLGIPQAWNRYSYVSNNPLGYRDPSGHFREEGYAGKRGCTDKYYCEHGKPRDVNWRKHQTFDYHTVLGKDASRRTAPGFPFGGGPFGAMAWAKESARNLDLASQSSTSTARNGRTILNATQEFRDAYGFAPHGGTYAAKTISTNVTSQMLRGALTKGNIFLALVTSFTDNAFDYAYGEHAGEPIGQEFAVSVAVDAGLAIAVTAGVVAGVGLLAISSPFWIAAAVVGGTFAAGIALDAVDADGHIEDWINKRIDGVEAHLGG